MENCCENKKAIKKDEKASLTCHMNRIIGQVNAIKDMIEHDKYCDDILIQISAASSSLKSVGLIIMEKHMNACVKEKIKSGDDKIIEEVIATIKRLTK